MLCLHRKIFKVCLAVLQHYGWKGQKVQFLQTLCKIFSVHGLPETRTSDNEWQFIFLNP